MNKWKVKRLSAFTLVELIIVITILAILATIAFISFQWYNKNARDSNRIATLNTIKKWLEWFQINTWFIPQPDNQYGIGEFWWIALTYVGNIGDTIARLINLNTTPKDPISKNNYVYGIDASKSKFQIAAVSETLQGNIFIPTSYAVWWYQAVVVWNYLWLLKYSNKIYNIPSLIATNTWSFSLTGTSINFIANKQENLPYAIGDITTLNYQTPTQILQKLANTGASLTVTGVTLPVTATEWNVNVGKMEAAFWYPNDVLGSIIFWDKYFTDIKTNTSITKMTIADCATSGQVLYGTVDGMDTGLTCNDDIFVCSWAGTWYAIASCNLGTTTVWILSPSYGNYYQWGNNWWTGATSVTVTGTLVNASGYGPGTASWYYNSSMFIWWIPSPGDWSSVQNNNLWWDVTNTVVARQWPCPSWYHVPSQGEWSNVVTKGWWGANANALRDNLKLPLAWQRNSTSGMKEQGGTYGNYWASTITLGNAYRLFFQVSSSVNPANSNIRIMWYPVRCFKN